MHTLITSFYWPQQTHILMDSLIEKGRIAITPFLLRGPSLHLHPQRMQTLGHVGFGIKGDFFRSVGGLAQSVLPEHEDQRHLGLVQGEPHRDAASWSLSKGQKRVPAIGAVPMCLTTNFLNNATHGSLFAFSVLLNLSGMNLSGLG